MVKENEENEEEEDEILTDWEKNVAKDLKGVKGDLANIKEDQKRLIALLSEKEAMKLKPKMEPKITSKLTNMIKKCTSWLTDFDVNKFVDLAQKEGIIGDDKFSDEDLALIRKALPNPDLFFEEIDYNEAIKTLSEKLGIDPSRFAIAEAEEEEIILPMDEEWWEEETPAKHSKITVIERKVSEEAPEEEE